MAMRSGGRPKIAASVQAYSSPNPFTISDLTAVWVVCDVYENDMAAVRA